MEFRHRHLVVLYILCLVQIWLADGGILFDWYDDIKCQRSVGAKCGYKINYMFGFLGNEVCDCGEGDDLYCSSNKVCEYKSARKQELCSGLPGTQCGFSYKNSSADVMICGCVNGTLCEDGICSADRSSDTEKTTNLPKLDSSGESTKTEGSTTETLLRASTVGVADHQCNTMKSDLRAVCSGLRPVLLITSQPAIEDFMLKYCSDII